MDQRKSLTRSIILVTSLFWIFHGLVFIVVASIYQMDSHLLLWYLVATIVLNGLLLAVLLYARNHFYFVETGIALEHVNLANKLTLFRISSLPSILLLLIAVQTYPVAVYLISYTVIAFITDTLDGLVSRRTHQSTRIGQYLDSMSDYAVLVAVSIAFIHFGFISLWFFILILVRFLFQWVAMGILFVKQRGYIEPRASFLGKASVASTMVVFALALLHLVPWFDPFTAYLMWFELAAAILLLVSLVEKAIFFCQDFRKTRS